MGLTLAAKERRKERRKTDAALYMQKLSALMATGAKCELCKHFGRDILGRGICELTSDFYGNTMVKETDLCLDFKEPQPHR